MAKEKKQKVDLWLDINNGMNRTGIEPEKNALQLYLGIARSPYLKIRGLHVYDGHIHDRALIDRHVKCEGDFEPVRLLILEIAKAGLDKPVVVAGGTPTFPIHASRDNTETSPGTCILWDSGYDEQFPDLSFLQAAVLLMRVVSKPAENLLCLDLGHKSIAAEMPHPRIKFFSLQVNRFLNHSEEHLVIETDNAGKYRCGDLVYGVPWHICPTVPRYPSAIIIQDRKIAGEWKIDARDRNT
jgi:D-serine deaminase-like pyridoxal phosphate-dependent protein